MEYDLARQRLIPGEEDRCEETPNGIPVLQIDTIDEVPFPAGQIWEMLDGERKKAGRGRYAWLMPDTRIDSITAGQASLVWKSSVRAIQVGPGMACTVEGIDDPQFVLRALQSLAREQIEEFPDIPTLQVANPDKEIREFVQPKDLFAAVSRRMRADPVFAASARFCRGDVFGGNAGKNDRRARIALIDGRGAFAVALRERQLLIEFPTKILPAGTVYLSLKDELRMGKFQFYAADTVQELPIGFCPAQPSGKAVEQMSSIARQYARQDLRVALVLYELGQKDAFWACVREACGACDGVNGRRVLLDQFNQACLKFYGKKLISVDDLAQLLVDRGEIEAAADSYSHAELLLDEYGKMDIFYQHDALYQSVVQQVLEQLPPAERLEELHGLWKCVKRVKQTHLTWLCKNNLYQCLYSSSVLRNLAEDFASEDFFAHMAEEYTPVEQTFYHMKQTVGLVQEMLPELEAGGIRSDEGTCSVVLLHRDKVERLQEEVRGWQNLMERFASRICPPEDLTGGASGFSEALLMMERVAGALSAFCDNSAVKYKRVVIADTSALMNRPELISWFEDGKAMPIIPQKVLTELDGLKSSEDEDTAYAAREAIRLIYNHQAYDWLNTRETSDVTLLNEDLDRNSADSKILSVAIRYIVKAPIILTDDINFKNIAIAQGITAVNPDSYEKERQHKEERPQGAARNKKKKKRR